MWSCHRPRDDLWSGILNAGPGICWKRRWILWHFPQAAWLWLPWLSHSRSCVSARLRNAYYQNEASIASNLQPIGRLEAKAGVVSRCFKHPIAQRTTSCSHNSSPWVGWIMSNPSRLLEFRTLSYASYCGSNSEDVLMRFTWRKNLSS